MCMCVRMCTLTVTSIFPSNGSNSSLHGRYRIFWLSHNAPVAIGMCAMVAYSSDGYLDM
jgi:hypothetical protein